MIDLAPCGCGSGLRRLRCCGLDLATISPAGAMAALAPLLAQADSALAAGQVEAARAHILQLLELAPGCEEALVLLYQMSRDGAWGAAEALIRRIVAINPNNFWATHELTLLLLRKGALAEAELHARNAVRIAPRSPQAHNLMGLVLTEANRPVVGEYHYRQVLALSDRNEPITLANLAWNLKNQGRMEEARALYERSVSLDGNIPQTLLGWAKLEEADRRFEAALHLLDKAQLLEAKNPSVQLTRATVLARLKRPQAALALLDADAADARSELGPAELSERGRLLDQLGRFDEAFAAFDSGKKRALEFGARTYLADAARDLAARNAGFFTARRLTTLPRAELRADMPQPIFIVGFPRSGTTLIEQTLSVHPGISAGDELPFINDITQIMPRLLASPLAYPEAMAELWMGDHRDGLDELRDYYLNRAAKSGIFKAGANWFTDKMPLNETHLGLISLLFPKSPILHVIRHPLDVLLSVYSNHLTHGFFCASQPETIAQHYMLISDLVEHYKSALSMRYLAVRYEDMVADQETNVRKILDFIGLDYDARCLSFEQNTRYARTASYAQVTEKLYDRSRFRYRHYLAQLQPVLEILRPVIDRLGYSVDYPIEDRPQRAPA